MNSDTANNYKYSGKERDSETGLDDFGARYYASNLGRFMTPDWAGNATAVPYAVFGDPQTLNLYSYVENGPMNRVDADGHTAIPITTVDGYEQGTNPTGPDPYGDPSFIESSNAAYEAKIEANGGQVADGGKPKIEAQQNGVQDKRDALAAAALDQAKKKSTAWSDTAPPCAGPKCNLFVAAMLKAVGIGQKKAPLAGDWATPGKTPKGWEMLPLGATPAPGDIAAYAHSGWSDATGHVGIVTAIDSRGIQVVATSGTHVYSTHDFNADQPNDVVRYSRYVGVP